MRASRRKVLAAGIPRPRIGGGSERVGLVWLVFVVQVVFKLGVGGFCVRFGSGSSSNDGC